MSLTGKRLCYAVVSETFRQLLHSAGVGTPGTAAPRLHDLRALVWMAGLRGPDGMSVARQTLWQDS